MSHLRFWQDERSVVLENAHLRLGFACTDDGIWYLDILQATTPEGTDWIAAQSAAPAPLWKARLLVERYASGADAPSRWELRSKREWTDIDSLAASTCMVEVQQQEGALVATLHWPEVTLPDPGGSLDITVRVTLEADSPVSRWTAHCACHATQLGLWELQFPLVGGLRGGEGTRLVVPDGWGVQIEHPANSQGYTGRYPCGRCVLQLIALTDGADTVYLAAEDPHACQKVLRVWADTPTDAQGPETVTYGVTQFPETMGSLRNTFETPFAAAIGVLPGSWEVAAKRYRAWALTTPWSAAGPVGQRRDSPRWMDEIAIWALAGSGREEDIAGQVHDVSAFAAYLGVPTAVHWYSWHQIPFDDHYPEYFPAKRGFREAVAELQRVGVRVMPYINGRLWDPHTDSWFDEQAVESCAKTLEQSAYVETYASHVVLATMCPATRQWQDKIAGIVERLTAELGVDAVYIDQIGAAPANLCFDRTHGHTIGGGDYWVRGYHALLMQARARGRIGRSDLALTTEDAAEPFGAHLDAYLMCNSTRADLVPLYPLIYSGRFLTFGRYIFEEDFADPTAFHTKLGQMFLFGAQLGWMPPASILKPGREAEAAYTRVLAQARAANQAYLARGELLPGQVVRGTVPLIRTRWCMWNPEADFAVQPMIPIEMPAVQGSLWRHADEERYALLLVNMSRQAEEIEWQAPLGAGRYTVSEQGSGRPISSEMDVAGPAGRVSVPALGVCVLELVPEP